MLDTNLIKEPVLVAPDAEIFGCSGQKKDRQHMKHVVNPGTPADEINSNVTEE